MSEKLRFEINSLDLRVLLGEINASLPRYVSQIYRGLDSSYIIRLTGRDDVRDLRIVPGKALFLAPGVYQIHGQLDRLASTLRRSLRGYTVRSAEQVIGERIARLQFERGVERYYLVVEVFPGGGLSLLDAGGVIVASTSLKRGEPYSWPARRETISSREEALGLLSSVDGRLKVGVALAREFGLGTKYSNEVLARAGIEPSRKISDLNEEEKIRIASGVEFLIRLLENPQPTAYKAGDRYVVFSPIPFMYLSSQGLEMVHTTSLNEAVSLVYESYLKEASDLERRRRIEEEVRRVEREVEEKKALVDQLRLKARESRELADFLHMRLAELKDWWGKIKAGRGPSGLVKSLDRAAGLVTIELDGRTVQLSLREPITQQIDELYNNAKTTMKGVENLLAEVVKLEEKLKQLRSSLQLTSKVVETVQIRKRGTEWYHRYRWSMTSSGRLIVLGRDASSNIRLLKKHLEDDDVVLHAEVRGSPVTLLKNGADAAEGELREAASICASFSRAWRDGLSSVSVYWVRPEQISFTPPQGMYLPRGSFIVKPPKNYIQVTLQVCVGYSERLGPIVGSEEWVGSEAAVYVVLSPGQEDAARVSQELAAKVEEMLNLPKNQLRPSDFTSLIPYGRCRLLRWSL